MMRCLIALFFVATGVVAQDADISRDAGLAAWDRIYAVASHPRCTNCHVGADAVPMWQGLGYKNARAHGMGIVAGDSRIGAETIPCRTCHVTSDRPNTIAHGAAHILEAWRLPPLELAWLGEDAASLCAQLRDPDRNDGNDIAGLVEHVTASPFVAWGFNPGSGRTRPPGDVASLAADLSLWGNAGTPCR